MKPNYLYLLGVMLLNSFCGHPQTSKTLFADWSTTKLPATGLPDGTKFAGGRLRSNVAYDPFSMKIVNGKMKFSVDSKVPVDPSVSSAKYNYRSEFTEWPWNINLPEGTEQWAGWSYFFPSDYVRAVTPITIHQNHAGGSNPFPAFELELTKPGQLQGALGGEVQVVNNINFPEIRIMTKFRPKAGDRLDIVLHVVHARGSNGLLEFWFNGTRVYSKVGDTIYPAPENWGGNNKWGVYHHEWTDPANVLLDIAAGHTKFELEMGNLRQITRSPSDPDYRKDARAAVDPLQDIMAIETNTNTGDEIGFVATPIPVKRGNDLSVFSASTGPFQLVLLNFAGQKIKQVDSNESALLNTADLAEGIYILNFIQSGTVRSKKIVVLDDENFQVYWSLNVCHASYIFPSFSSFLA